MARKTTPGTHSHLIHCDRCGEDYSSTYRSCPFCEDEEDAVFPAPQPEESDSPAPASQAEDEFQFDGGDLFDEEPPVQTKGGKRLLHSSSPAPKKIRVSFVLSLLLIAAAAVIVIISVVMPLLRSGQDPDGQSSPGTSQSPGVSQSPEVSDPGAEQSPDSSDPGASQDPDVSDIPEDQTATDFTLSHEEFTISSRYPDPVQLSVTFLPSGSTGTITWTSSNPDAVTVSDTGLVQAVGEGTATITATMAGGITHTCRVISTVSEGTGTGTAASGAALDKTDFTLPLTGNNSYTLHVLRLPAGVTVTAWASENTSVATVNAGGTVTAAGTGRTNVTATLSNGEVLTCIVRVR